MAIHIWCPRASDTAVALRNAFREKGIAAYKSKPGRTAVARFLRRVNPDDLWINWGKPYPDESYTRKALNFAANLNKRDQLQQLAREEIPVPRVFTTAGTGRLGRSFRHQEAHDLINETGQDFWTEKLPLHHEIRVHVFQGKAIYTGMKVPRTDFPNPHPWIRSYDTGWKIDYSQAHRVKKGRRALAKRAVEALGLDFGAVDIGVTEAGKPYVLEVNLAPGLEGGALEAYVRHFLDVHNAVTNHN